MRHVTVGKENGEDINIYYKDEYERKYSKPLTRHD